MVLPKAAASATAAPVMPANSTDDTMHDWAMPPRRWPTRASENFARRSVMPAWFISSPAKMNKRHGQEGEQVQPGEIALRRHRQHLGAADLDDAQHAGDAEHVADRHADGQQDEEGGKDPDHDACPRDIGRHAGLREVAYRRQHQLQAHQRTRTRTRRRTGSPSSCRRSSRTGWRPGAPCRCRSSQGTRRTRTPAHRSPAPASAGCATGTRCSSAVTATCSRRGHAAGDGEQGGPDHQVARQFLGPGHRQLEHVAAEDADPDVDHQDGEQAPHTAVRCPG